VPRSDEAASGNDLLQRMRDLAYRCRGEVRAAADGLAAGFQQVDDVIVLLQPLRVVVQEDHEALAITLERLAEKSFLAGMQPVGDGGVWVALVSGCAGHRRGFHAELSEIEGATAAEALLSERGGRVLVSARPKAHLPLANFVERGGRFTAVFEAASIEDLAR
jgi:phosphoribosylformylglycinamidine (FGAM) synthase-like enzyme